MTSTEIINQTKQMYIPFHILDEITKGFSDEQKIGSGGYAKVYKGIYNEEEIAVKLLNDDVQGGNGEQFKNECLNLMRINHPNIVRFIGYCYETHHKPVEYQGDLRFCQHISRILCFEYLRGGSLDKHLKEHHDHDWQTHYKIIKGICEGLKFLHGGCGFGPPILHLDLKPANILLNKNMVAKIADFGLSRIFAGTSTHVTKVIAGTQGYMAPELLTKQHITSKNDVYSLGVIILQIMAGYSGYSEFREMNNTKEIIELVSSNWRERINATTSPCPSAESDQVKACIEIAIKCVDHEKIKRPSVAEVVDILNETEKRIPEEWRNRAQFLMRQGLRAIVEKSPGGTFNDLPVPDKPKLSVTFSQLLDTILRGTGTTMDTENSQSQISGRRRLAVVIVYAFDCSTTTPAWCKMDDVYWLVHEKLTHMVDSIGYIFVMSESSNTYVLDMKLVDAAEETSGYRQSSAWRKATCTKNMAYGLHEANKLISDRGNHSGVILLFSDGSAYQGDFFDGAEECVSQVPVHTFTLFPEE